MCPQYAFSAATSAPASRPAATASQPSGDLRDIAGLMSQAGSRLATGRADATTQGKQREAIDMIDRLIKWAESQQQQQQSKSCKACRGKGCRLCRKGVADTNQPPGSPAQQSTVSPGQGREGELRPSTTARPGEVWGGMRPEERERVLQSFGKDFPSQYRQLVEQYYKQLGKEK